MTVAPPCQAMLGRMEFGGRWRDYQQRALAEFDSHLADSRLHVVAAPGSGKTVLGLEIMRRIGRPTLILAPTRTIRDQWPARLVPLFLQTAPNGNELSFDLATLRTMTVATYQALHSYWADEDGHFSSLVEALRAAGPITLILDEAHHLRREWWKALQALADALPDAYVVSLTATPPYDAPYSEWARYDAMCGPIDLEIGVPELVRNGDLCPHQDHVVFATPTADLLELLNHRRKGIAAIQMALRSDGGWLDMFQTHPWLTAPDSHAEEILEAPEMLSAILVLLTSAGRKMPRAPLALLGIRDRELPSASAFWLETLLHGVLFRFPQLFPIDKARIKWLRTELHEHGLIEGGRVRLAESRSLFGLMAGNLAKLASIADIAHEESANLGDSLRMVVLSDHVRAGELPKAADRDYVPGKLGVVPIFETLRRAGIEGQKLGVLTGTLIIIPHSAEAPLVALGTARGIRPADLTFEPMANCPGFLRNGTANASHQLVELVTALFTAGEITLLIGTQALLGEGWDAPALNSLVLASNSAAFMASNQMRGRAVRIDPARPDKVANIWHLATVGDTTMGQGSILRNRLDWGLLDDGEDIGSDLALLGRRFRAFEGISNGPSTRIENGMDRLAIDAGSPPLANRRSFGLARGRTAIAEAWRRSLGDASPHAHVRETVAPDHGPQALSWSATLQWLLVSALASGLMAAANQLRATDEWSSTAYNVQLVAGVILLASLPKLLKALWLFFRNGSLERSLFQVGTVVLASLHHSGAIPSEEMAGICLEVRRNLSGRYDMVLQGASRATERIVMQSLAEILGPIQNPRFLLVRRSWFGLWRRADYHAVPAVIGQRTDWAEFFHHKWLARVGYSKLVPTRSAKGRRELLRARARSFAAGFQRKVDRRSIWM